LRLPRYTQAEPLQATEPQLHDIHKHTWAYPAGKTYNQIEGIQAAKDDIGVVSFNGADGDTDHKICKVAEVN
jgi:hypothetical protein